MNREFEFWIDETRFTGFCEVHVKDGDGDYELSIANIEVEEHKTVDIEQDERKAEIKAKINEFMYDDKTLIEDYDEFCRDDE